MKKTWAQVDRYIEDLFFDEDDPLNDVLRISDKQGLEAINISPTQGRFLQMLVEISQAHNILEIGTLAGYSTLWLARAISDKGHIITLEIDPKCAQISRDNFKAAGMDHKITLKEGAALKSLADMKAEGGHVFDFVFIDADKQSNTEYFEYALEFAKSGTVILVDNVVRNGDIVDQDNYDEKVKGVKRMNERLKNEPRISVTQIQTVGSKGYDGFALIRVL